MTCLREAELAGEGSTLRWAKGGIGCPLPYKLCTCSSAHLASEIRTWLYKVK